MSDLIRHESGESEGRIVFSDFPILTLHRRKVCRNLIPSTTEPGYGLLWRPFPEASNLMADASRIWTRIESESVETVETGSDLFA